MRIQYFINMDSISKEYLANIPKMLKDSRYELSVTVKNGTGIFPFTKLLSKNSKELLYSFLDNLIKSEIIDK